MDKVQKENLVKYSSYISLTVATVILSIKLYGWLKTDSQSILASLIDSMLDISSSFLNLLAVRIVLQPPDHNHRFGHEKFQDLAIFSQSIFFLASSLFTFGSSVKILVVGSTVVNHAVGLNIMYLSIVLTLGLVIFQSFVLKKTKSNVVAADKLHYFSDLLTNIAVVISIHFCNEYWIVDPLIGVGISIYIFYGSYSLFKITFRNLVDEELDDAERKKIVAIITNYPEIKGVHDLKTRYAGDKIFIQLHLEMDGKIELLEAHKISDRITLKLLEAFPGSEIIIHQDPYGIEEPVSYREKI